MHLLEENSSKPGKPKHDPNAVDKKGRYGKKTSCTFYLLYFCRTALHLAAVKEDPALIDLLAATAVPSCRIQDSDGNTPLHKVTVPPPPSLFLFFFPVFVFLFCIPCGEHNIYTHHYLHSRI